MAGPGREELDGQGNAVEPPADLPHRFHGPVAVAGAG
jgi:hypothetical protein